VWAAAGLSGGLRASTRCFRSFEVYAERPCVLKSSSATSSAPSDPEICPSPGAAPCSGAKLTVAWGEAVELRRRRFCREIVCGEWLALDPGPNALRIAICARFPERSLTSVPCANRARAPRRCVLVPWHCAFVFRVWLGMIVAVRKVSCGGRVARWRN